MKTSDQELKDLIAEWRQCATHQQTLAENGDENKHLIAAGRMAVFFRCAAELENILVNKEKNHDRSSLHNGCNIGFCFL